MDTGSPRISVEYADGNTVVAFVDQQLLEDRDIQAVHESVMAVVEQAEKPSIILDFGNIKFFSSAVLGMLIRISRRVYEKNGGLRLCCINPRIAEIFRITRLDRIFDIRKDVKEALDSLA